MSFAIPSRGRIGERALEFLASCGLTVLRPNPKQYAAEVPSMPELRIHLQRASDIIEQIADGNADIGITGLDLYLEHKREGDDVEMLHEDLGFSHARLEVAVPDNWVDVSHIHDLAEVALTFRHEGRNLRVATSFPSLTRGFFLKQSINNFQLMESAGSVEAAPALGSADVIVDVVETGTALKENRLKTVAEGTVLESRACLLGNLRSLKASGGKRDIARRVLELIEAHLEGRRAFTLTANVQGETEEEVARRVLANSEVAGVEGPTISKVYSKSPAPGVEWYAVSVTVKAGALLRAVDHLRSIGASSVIARPTAYVFYGSSKGFSKLLKKLGLEA